MERFRLALPEDDLLSSSDNLRISRMHLGVNHMIVVTELSRDIIDRVLRELEAKNLLLEHTQPNGESGARPSDSPKWVNAAIPVSQVMVGAHSAPEMRSVEG